jgi:hypothetical protein
MADTTTTNVKLTKFEASSRQGTWKTDFDLLILDVLDKMAGTQVTQAVTTGAVTLTDAQIQAAGVVCTGTLVANATLNIPTGRARYMMIVNNVTMGGFTFKALNVGGATTDIPAGNNLVWWPGDGSAPRVVSLTAAASAPPNASFVCIGLDPTLTNERTLAVGGSLAMVDSGAGAAVTLSRAALTGDVTAAANANATTIAADAVDNAKLANMAQGTIKGRPAGSGTGDPGDLTGAQVYATLNEATTAQFWANSAPDAPIATDVLWASANEVSAGPTSSLTLDFASGINFVVNLNQACGMNNPVNIKNGQAGTIRFYGGGVSYSLFWGTVWLFEGGVKPTTNSVGHDMLFYYCVNSGFMACSMMRLMG